MRSKGMEKWTVHDRVVAILKGNKPDRLPFIDRLEMWYEHHRWAGTLPEEFEGMSLTGVHAAVGMGQQKFVNPYGLRLRKVDMVYAYEGEVFHRETEPVMEHFLCPWAPPLISTDKPGITLVEFITPTGTVSLKYEVSRSNIHKGMEPYLREHLIKKEADYRIVEYILEHVEFVPQFEKIIKEQNELGDRGFVVPDINRIPFQQILLEFLGELPLFYALYDSPSRVKRLINRVWLKSVARVATGIE